MMLYEVPSSFIKIDETKGILQNASSGNSLEVSNENEVNSGIILKPGESLSFQDTDIYVRTVGSNKNSAVRVVPFVDGFSVGDTPASVDSDFDIRKFNATGILIYSTDPAGTLLEKPVYYVNPESTNSQLVELGKSIVAVTDNSYQATYRVTKALCDGQPDSGGSKPDYSPYLVVDLPLTNDLTDRCGNIWNVNGSISFEDGALKLEKSNVKNYIYTNPPAFTDQNFTITWDEFIDGSRNSFDAEIIVVDGADGSATHCLDICYYSSSTPRLYLGNGGSDWLIRNDSIGTKLRDQWVHRAVVRSGNTIAAFENYGLPYYINYSFNYSLNVAGSSLFIGNFARANGQFVGKIKNVKIYLGVANLYDVILFGQ